MHPNSVLPISVHLLTRYYLIRTPTACHIFRTRSVFQRRKLSNPSVCGHPNGMLAVCSETPPNRWCTNTAKQRRERERWVTKNEGKSARSMEPTSTSRIRVNSENPRFPN